MFYVTNYPDELYHHGIKGMKWGVRRFQRRDGSLTNEGARRYANSKDAYRNAKSEYKQAKKAYSKSYDKAYGYSSRHFISQYVNKSKKAKSDALWGNAYDKAREQNAAKAKYKQAKSDYKDAKKAYRAENGPKLSDKQKKMIKVGVAVAGTALAAYGTYKLAKYVQNERLAKATAKAEKYVNDNFFVKYGETGFTNGVTENYYRNGRGMDLTIGSKGSKEIGKYNAKVVARGRRMYDEITDTRLDRGLSKVVNAGNAVGNTARKAGNAVGNTARKAGNRVLDKINPIYTYTPGDPQTTKIKWAGMDATQTITPYYKRKVRRG